MLKVIDLRSDTVTRPSEAMRRIIASAEVGDDVFGDDPTVKHLEQKVSEILGKESALFVPSGTMANQVALRTLCEAGDEVICERKMHIVNYEVASASALSGIMLSPYDGKRGRLSPEQVRLAVRPYNIHHPHTRLVALENTHNGAGGTVLDLDYIASIEKVVKENSLYFYLDGARIWNAAVALEVEPKDIARPFNLVSVCFSKGLGAPVGSAVCGDRMFIDKARRVRQMMGGGMRQVGIIASAALYALKNNFERLKEDHVRAKKLACGLEAIDGVSIKADEVETNIVIFKIDVPVARFVQNARKMGLLLVPFGPDLVRAVTHLDISDDDVST
ncbi:MAG: low specificity L-threonine aldolase, partial [Candidatus Zixiibacteriota bacterium]